MKSIAVILVNYNGLDDSIECIESIKKSDCQNDVAVVFVDNASRVDETKVIKNKFSDVIVIRSDHNGGFSAGNNIGIKYALTENFKYIVLLNNDTIIDPQMITKLKENCAGNIVTVPKMFYYFEPNKIWYGGGHINRWTGNAKHNHMNKIDHSDEVEYVSFATGCCMMLCSETIKKVGLLDEKYFMYCEDTDLCIRLIQNNIKIKYIPSAKLWHKVSSSSGDSNSPFCIYYITRNRLLYLKKYTGFFHKTAYMFSLGSRYIRLLQCKDLKKKDAYVHAIHDAHVGKNGKSNNF